MIERLIDNFDLWADAPNGVPELRKMILSLAVQGRLVPRNSEDEPASALLAQIEEEKRQLPKQGRTKKQKALPPLTADELPFDIPRNWQWTRLIQLGTTQTGTTPKKADTDAYGSDYPFVKPADILPNVVIYDNDGLSQKGVETYGRLASTGSVLMVCIGTIGKCNLIDRDCSFNQQINALTPWPQIDSNLLNYFMRSSYFQSEAWNRSSSTTISILNKGKWETIPVPLPPLAEQKRIVAKVDQLMALCDDLEARQQEQQEKRQLVNAACLHALTTATPKTQPAAARRLFDHFDPLYTHPQTVTDLRKTILQLAVQGKLVPQDRKDEPAKNTVHQVEIKRRRYWENQRLARFLANGKQPKNDKWKNKYKTPCSINSGELFELSASWSWVTWEQVLALDEAPFKRGPFGSALKKAFFVESGYKVYEQYCPINDDCSYVRYFITPKKFKEMESFAVRAGDYLISCSGVTLGRITQVPKHFDEGIINQAILRVRVHEDLLDSDYFKMFFRSPYFQEQIFSNSTGSAIPNVKGVKELKSMPIPLPPLAEQKRIVAKVDQLMALCDDLEAKLTQAHEDAESLAASLVHHLCDAQTPMEMSLS